MVLVTSQDASAQTFRVDDPVIRQMWTVGMEQSQTENLAQILTDFIGPRLAGSPNLDAAGDWALGKYEEWGVPARKERYGTWNGWQFGITHSDHISFLCTGAPSFRLQAAYDEYRQYTWHTNRDTYDKISFDDLKNNATLAAMLAYAASEDPERVPRDRTTLPIDPGTGEPRQWVQCRPPRRSGGGG